MIKIFKSKKYANYLYLVYSGELTKNDSLSVFATVSEILHTKEIKTLFVHFEESAVLVEKKFLQNIIENLQYYVLFLDEIIVTGIYGVQNIFFEKIKNEIPKKFKMLQFDSVSDVENTYQINFSESFFLFFSSEISF
jgi:heterodisulfide reductase subunit C